MNKGLECRNIHFSYTHSDRYRHGTLTGIRHCFKASESTVVAGPTGSGKSTLLYLLAGLIRPTQGQILADGHPISRWIGRHLDLWRRKVGLVFQEPHLLPNLNVMANVAAPLIPLKLKRLEIERRISALLEQLDLSNSATRPAGRLSGGERQRVTLARALIVRPRFLLADEPTAFQDDNHTLDILNLFQKARHQGSCVVICSHDGRLKTANQIDVILRLNKGRLEST